MKTGKVLKNNQSGFTLVEIAIVLVIIGLLLGGVLKGQEMIDNAKVKRAINDFNAISAAANSYYDRFQRLAGDDGPAATLNARGGLWSGSNTIGSTAGDNSGAFRASAADTFTAAGSTATSNNTLEQRAFFFQLRRAGFLNGSFNETGNVPANVLPKNPFNGLVGVTTDSVMGNGGNFLMGTKVCMNNVPGKAAQAIDTQIDDSIANTGILRAQPAATGGTAGTLPTAAPITGNLAVPAAGTTGYSETEYYTICRSL